MAIFIIIIITDNMIIGAPLYQYSQYALALTGFEVPGIELQFSKDGVYSGIPSKKLQPGSQYSPADGPFVILSDRQLYMANNWDDEGLYSQGVCDVLVSDDELFFTSLERGAYFALKKRAE